MSAEEPQPPHSHDHPKSSSAQQTEAPDIKSSEAPAPVASTDSTGTVSTATSNQLQELLAARPGQKALAKKNIVKNAAAAPALRNTLSRLERQMKSDKVGRGLSSRPSRQELDKAGILTTKRAHRLQGRAKMLERNMKRDQVGRLIERRPMSQDLAQQGILRAGVNVAARIQGVQQTLARNLAKSNLYHGLKHRPTVQELKARGVYVERQDEQDELGSLYSHEYSQDYSHGFDIAHDEEKQYYNTQSGFDIAHDEEKQYYDNTQSKNAPPLPEANYQRRSKSFHLTRILLKYVNSWGETGDLSIAQKGVLKDLIVDQDQVILAVAEAFDAENDLNDFKDSLLRLTTRAQ